MVEENPADSGRKPDKELSSTPPRYTRSNLRGNLLILVVALVVIAGGVFFWQYLNTYESTDDAQVDVHLYPVSARISGYVVKVSVNDNKYGQKNKVLVEID